MSAPSDAELRFHLSMRLRQAAAASKSARPAAMKRLAEIVRQARTLTDTQAELLADILEGKRANRGGRPKEETLHWIVRMDYMILRNASPDASDAAIFRRMSKIRWPYTKGEDGNIDHTKTRMLSADAIRDILSEGRPATAIPNPRSKKHPIRGKPIA